MHDELRVNSAFSKGNTFLLYEQFHNIKRGNTETIRNMELRVKLFEKIVKFTASHIMANTKEFTVWHIMCNFKTAYYKNLKPHYLL